MLLSPQSSAIAQTQVSEFLKFAQCLGQSMALGVSARSPIVDSDLSIAHCRGLQGQVLVLRFEQDPEVQFFVANMLYQKVCYQWCALIGCPLSTMPYRNTLAVEARKTVCDAVVSALFQPPAVRYIGGDSINNTLQIKTNLKLENCASANFRICLVLAAVIVRSLEHWYPMDDCSSNFPGLGSLKMLSWLARRMFRRPVVLIPG